MYTEKGSIKLTLYLFLVFIKYSLSRSSNIQSLLHCGFSPFFRVFQVHLLLLSFTVHYFNPTIEKILFLNFDKWYFKCNKVTFYIYLYLAPKILLSRTGDFFYYFRGIGDIMVIFQVLRYFGGFKGILDILGVFQSFQQFQGYCGHLQCILVILVVQRVFLVFLRFWVLLVILEVLGVL